MTPAHTNTPLRRSGISKGADETIAANVTINDDDAERQESRRRTLLNTSTSLADSTATLEDNETLKKCLEFYNGNKLSKENAWSMSLIDTLSRLLDRHHKSLSNFKVAGSSLEASSKVYGLRVDSIHNDVLRLSAGLNAKKFAGRNLDEDDDDDESNQAEQAEGGNVGADAASQEGAAQENAAPKAKPKRQRKPKSTITKNKETINGKLDTVPLQDPIFGKLNTIVGSINSSTRLMNNILPTADSELRLRTTFSFWDKSDFPTGSNPSEKFNFFAAVPENAKAFTHLMPCDRLFRVENLENLQLRSLHTGYIISDTPDPITDDKDSRRMSLDSIGGNDFDDGGLLSSQAQPDAPDVFHNSKELSMAFDMNAECEPMPMLDEQAPILNVDFNEMEEITQGKLQKHNSIIALFIVFFKHRGTHGHQ